MKDKLQTILALAGVLTIALGAISYFAKASELREVKEYARFVELRLDQKIVEDRVYSLKNRSWQLEDRNSNKPLSDWNQDDKDQYRIIQQQIKNEELKLKKSIDKGG